MSNSLAEVGFHIRRWLQKNGTWNSTKFPTIVITLQNEEEKQSLLSNTLIELSHSQLYDFNELANLSTYGEVTIEGIHFKFRNKEKHG